MTNKEKAFWQGYYEGWDNPITQEYLHVTTILALLFGITGFAFFFLLGDAQGILALFLCFLGSIYTIYRLKKGMAYIERVKQILEEVEK